MNLRRFILPLFAVAFLVTAAQRVTETRYLAPGTLDAVQLLAPPPAPGSDEERIDRDTAYRVHTAVTPEQLALAKDENQLTIFHFAPAIGPWFQRGKFPRTEELFKEVEAESKAVTNAGKDHWQRARPYHADPERFANAIEHEGKTSYSYPSGHATRGTVFALLLAELFPEKRDAILAQGREIGWLRVQGGVHYPTDIYAGRVLGQALAEKFLRSPAFQRDFAEAKAELVAAIPAL
jgi:acid phosphatase (class A)